MMLPEGADPLDQHEPERLVTDYTGQIWRVESDGTRYTILVVDDPRDLAYVLVMYDSWGNGHGEWATMRREGVIASTYVDEKFRVRSEVDLYHLTRLIAAALGRKPYQQMRLEEKEAAK